MVDALDFRWPSRSTINQYPDLSDRPVSRDAQPMIAAPDE